MPLFDLPAGNGVPLDEPLLTTPLGTLVLRLRSVDGTAFVARPTAAYATGATARWLSWDLASARVELLLSRPQPRLPEGMRVASTDAAVWRIEARGDLPALTFGCEWTDDRSWTTCEGPNSGERLESQAWNDGTTRVEVGTEGDDPIRERASAGEWLPGRLALNSTWPDSVHIHRPDGRVQFIPLVTLRPDRVDVRVPNLREGERFQCHVVCCSAAYDDGGLDTRYGVDLNPRELIADAARDSSRSPP